MIIIRMSKNIAIEIKVSQNQKKLIQMEENMRMIPNKNDQNRWKNKQT